VSTAVEERIDGPTTGGRDPDLIHIAPLGQTKALCGLIIRADDSITDTDAADRPCVVCIEIDRAQRIRHGL
jgi:hypothetical protein